MVEYVNDDAALAVIAAHYVPDSEMLAALHCNTATVICRKRMMCELTPEAQAIFFRRRHQPRRPPLAKIRPGRPAPTMGPGTPTVLPTAPLENDEN